MKKKTTKKTVKKSSNLLGKGKLNVPMRGWKSKKTQVPLTEPRAKAQVPKFLDKVRKPKKKVKPTPKKVIKKKKPESKQLPRLSKKTIIVKKEDGVLSTNSTVLKEVREMYDGPIVLNGKVRVNGVPATDVKVAKDGQSVSFKLPLAEVTKIITTKPVKIKQGLVVQRIASLPGLLLDTKVIYDTALHIEECRKQGTELTENQIKGHMLFVLADKEGMTVRDTVKHADLLAKIGLTIETCTSEVISEAMARTTEADEDLRNRQKAFNEKVSDAPTDE